MKKATFFLLIFGAIAINIGSTLRLPESLRPGKDYALFFAINDYDYWEDLANPISEVEAIAKDLKDLYGFKTEIMRNPDKKTILDKIEEYRKKTYDKDAQLLIFFSGHGEFNEAAMQGFFVPKGGLKEDEYGESYIEYEFLKRRISSLPCNHIMLALDACYSGTADESIAMRGKPGERPGDTPEAERERYISTSLQYKTRIMLTSGAKVRTPDKSQFAAKFLEALRSQGNNEKLINLSRLLSYIGTAVPKPVVSSFTDHEPGGEFIFVLDIYTLPDDLIKRFEETAYSAQDLAAWQEARSTGTQVAYKEYISQFPSGAFYNEANIAIQTIQADEQAWNKAKLVNTIESYNDYLDKFSYGNQRTEAIAELRKLEESLILRRDDLAWEVSKEKNTIESYKKYQTDFPKGRHRETAAQEILRLESELALQRDNSAWKAVKTSNSLHAYKKYLIDYPNGQHLQEALERIKNFETPLFIDSNMVFVAGGKFEMGCTIEQKDCYNIEKPKHIVSVSGFYIGKYEVTQKQWKHIMGENPSAFKDCDECPVENVSWNDVQEFIGKLNAQTGHRYRLPTEAEWEYAARGAGQKILLGNGKNIANPEEINFDGDRNPTTYSIKGIDRKKTTIVGSFNPNKLGLYDMSGNVMEWCNDRFDYYSSTPLVNPNGSSFGKLRVLRGGSWYDKPENCRTAYRCSFSPDNRSNMFGFRLAK